MEPGSAIAGDLLGEKQRPAGPAARGASGAGAEILGFIEISGEQAGNVGATGERCGNGIRASGRSILGRGEHGKSK